LPTGVDKATGVKVALKEPGSLHNLVGIGDAENDHAFLGVCECSSAVDNALPARQDRLDWINRGSHGAGVEELIEKLLANDLQDVLDSRLGSRV
jgi:hydroxymethylpyrimidine pyrophosphatase-like HAD family hydrolase